MNQMLSEVMPLLETIPLTKWVDIGLEMGLKVALALVILVVGWLLAKMARRFVRKAMIRARLDVTLAQFLANIVYALLGLFVLIAALNNLGVQTASLVAMIGAAGLAIGLALQGSLSNFAAGVMIIIFKHFKVGDAIKTNEVDGTVVNLDIFNTTVLTANNQKVVVPNARLTENAITNFSQMPTRRIEITLLLSYEESVDRVKSIAMQQIQKNEYILSEPAPQVVVAALPENGVKFLVHAWVKTEHYLATFYGLQEHLKKAFDEEHILMAAPLVNNTGRRT